MTLLTTISFDLTWRDIVAEVSISETRDAQLVAILLPEGDSTYIVETQYKSNLKRRVQIKKWNSMFNRFILIIILITKVRLYK